jgi:hypothetical protein
MDQNCGENAICLQSSKNSFKNEYGCCKDIRFEVLHWGIDTERFSPGETKGDKVFIYCKTRNSVDLEFIENELQKRNVSYKIFGNTTTEYTETEYLQYLKESKYGICIESQSMEALSCDVPLLLWNIPYMSEDYGSNWEEQCGEYFCFKDQFSSAYDEFMENIQLDKYTPRKYILNNFSIEICERKLINIIHSM